MSKTLPRLDLKNSRPHEGTPDYPGGQVEMIRAALEYEVVSVLCGRDSGKSVSLFFLFLAEGRRTRGHYNFGLVSQGHSDAERVFKSWLKIFQNAGKRFVTEYSNKGQYRSISVRAFGENSGATVYFWSGEAEALDNIRGVRLNRLAVDEAGFVNEKVLATCTPMLLSRDGKSLFIGTARRGGQGFAWFKDKYDRGVAGEAGYKSFSWPSEANPYTPRKKIAFERRALRDPRYPDVKTAQEAEEFDGAFIDDIGAVFRNLGACIVLPYRKVETGVYVGVDERGVDKQPIPGRQYVIGRDHGKKIDHSVSSVFDRSTHDQVFLHVESVGAPYEEQLVRLSALRRRWNNALVVADARDAGNYINERLRVQYGDRLRELALTGQGENSKGAHVARMKHLFDEEAWHLLAVPEQMAQFGAFAQIPMGKHQNGWYYECPPPMHDDIVLSALFAATVIQAEPRRVLAPRPEVEPMTPEWFVQRQKERRRVLVRRGSW